MHKHVYCLPIFLSSALLFVSGGVAGAKAAKGGTNATAAKKFTKKEAKAFQKPVKVLINAIRYKKDALAVKMLDLDEMTHEACIDHWAKMTAAQRKEFSDGLGTLLKRLSFPKARELFEHIDAILYDPPQVKGDPGKENRATLRSTIVVHRAYKKKELVLTWTLTKSAKRKWRILDVTTVGESTIEGIREAEINPLVEEGGVALLMKELRAKIAETE